MDKDKQKLIEVASDESHRAVVATELYTRSDSNSISILYSDMDSHLYYAALSEGSEHININTESITKLDSPVYKLSRINAGTIKSPRY